MSPNEALEMAAENCGGVFNLALKINVRTQSIYEWKKRQIPAKRVLDIERVSGVPRHLLRPDLYPPGEYALANSGKQEHTK